MSYSIDWPELSLQLVLTFGHFLWQACVVGVLLEVGLKCLAVLGELQSARGSSVAKVVKTFGGDTDSDPKFLTSFATEGPAFATGRSAAMNYSSACAAFFLLPVCVLVTFGWIHHSRGAVLVEVSESVQVPKPVPATIDETHSTPLTSAVSSVFTDELPPRQPAVTRSPVVDPPPRVAEPQPTRTWIERLQPYAPSLLIGYAMGVSLLLARFGVSLIGSVRLRQSIEAITDTKLLTLVSEQSSRLRLRKVPLVALCQRVTVPVVVGILKPMILLPPALVTGLGTDQLAAILSHEMAHIRRYDLLVNLLQRVVEALLFFHPVTWWISRRISIERENCCDDLAARSAGSLFYVDALLKMAEVCLSNDPRRKAALASLAASGSGSTQLGRRIRRLVGAQQPTRIAWSRRVVGGFVALVILAGVSLAAWAHRTDEPSKDDDKETAIPAELSPDSNAKAQAVADVAATVRRILSTPYKPNLRRTSGQLGSHQFQMQLQLMSISNQDLVADVLMKDIESGAEFKGRRTAVSYCTSYFPDRLLPYLLRRIKAERSQLASGISVYDPTWPYERLNALKQIGAPAAEAIPDLIGLLAQPDANARAAVIETLVRVGPESKTAMNAIAQCFDDRDERVQSTAAYQAGRYGTLAKPLGPGFVELLNARSEKVRYWAAAALVTTGFDPDRGFQFLLDAAQPGKSTDRKQAILAIAMLGSRSEEVLPQLRSLLQNENDAANDLREAIKRIETDDRIPTHAAEAKKQQTEAKRRKEAVEKLKDALGGKIARDDDVTVFGRVLDPQGNPIPNATVSCSKWLDNHRGRSEVRSDRDGRFEFETTFDLKNRDVVNILQLKVLPPDDSLGVREFIVQNGRATGKAIGIENHSDENGNSIVVTLPWSQELAVDFIDRATQLPLENAAVFYRKDKLTPRYDKEGSYETTATWIPFQVTENGQTTYTVPVEFTSDKLLLQAFAEGYERVELNWDVPQNSQKPVKLQVAMPAASPVDFVLTQPDGTAASGARLSMRKGTHLTNTVFPGNGAGLFPWLHVLVTTDENGRISFPAPAFKDWITYEVKEPTGYAFLPGNELPTASSNQNTITLTPYLQIGGRCLPSFTQDEYLQVRRWADQRHGQRLRVGDDGSFLLSKRTSGWYEFSHMREYGSRAEGRWGTNTVASYGVFRLKDASVLDLVLGETGRRVTGKVILPKLLGVELKTLTLSVSAGEHPGFPLPPALLSENEKKQWYESYWETDDGRQLNEFVQRNRSVSVNPDGQFLFPYLPSGDYQLKLSGGTRRDVDFALSQSSLTVPEGKFQTVDLGAITAQSPKQPETAKKNAAVGFSGEATTVTGRVLGPDRKPISGADISCIPYAGGPKIDGVYTKTDDDGRFEATFSRRDFRVHIASPNEELGNTGFRVKNGRVVTDNDVETRPDEGTNYIVATLPRSYQLTVNVIDDETQQPIRDAAVLFKEDESTWYQGEEGDYETAAYEILLVVENGEHTHSRKAWPVMGLAHFRAIAPGYEPAEIKGDARLERGKPVTKTIRLKPLPPVQLTVRQQDGAPVAGARFEGYPPRKPVAEFRQSGGVQLKRLHQVKVTTDASGVATFPRPAFGRWASYRVIHDAGHAEFKVGDIPKRAANKLVVPFDVELIDRVAIQGRLIPKIRNNEFLELYRLKFDRMSVDGPVTIIRPAADGTFRIPDRLAGWHTFVHRAHVTHNDGQAGTQAIAGYGPFKLKGGEARSVTLGSEGRSVVGQLKLPAGETIDFSGLQIYTRYDSPYFYPHAPQGLNDDERRQWWDGYWNSDQARSNRSYLKRNINVPVAADGSFHFPLLPPGTYELRFNKQYWKNRPGLEIVEPVLVVPEEDLGTVLDLQNVAVCRRDSPTEHDGDHADDHHGDHHHEQPHSNWHRLMPQRIDVVSGSAMTLPDRSIHLTGDDAWQEVTLEFEFQQPKTIQELRFELLQTRSKSGLHFGRNGHELILFDVKPSLRDKDGKYTSLEFESCRSLQFPDDDATANCIDYLSDTGWTVPKLPRGKVVHELVFRLEQPLTLKPGERLGITFDSGGSGDEFAILNRVRCSIRNEETQDPAAARKKTLVKPEAGPQNKSRLKIVVSATSKDGQTSLTPLVLTERDILSVEALSVTGMAVQVSDKLETQLARFAGDSPDNIQPTVKVQLDGRTISFLKDRPPSLGNYRTILPLKLSSNDEVVLENFVAKSMWRCHCQTRWIERSGKLNIGVRLKGQKLADSEKRLTLQWSFSNWKTAPTTVYVTLPDGNSQQFTLDKNQKLQMVSLPFTTKVPPGIYQADGEIERQSDGSYRLTGFLTRRADDGDFTRLDLRLPTITCSVPQTQDETEKTETKGNSAAANAAVTPATKLGRTVHEQMTVIDQLPQFYWTANAGTQSEFFLKNPSKDPLKNLIRALDAADKTASWFRYKAQLGWDEKHFVEATDNSFNWGTREIAGQRYGSGEKISHVLQPNLATKWKDSYLTFPNYVLATRHQFWWGVNGDHRKILAGTGIPPEVAEYEELSERQFDGELCRVARSKARKEMLLISKASGLLRGYVLIDPKGYDPEFYKSIAVTEITGRTFETQREYGNWYHSDKHSMTPEQQWRLTKTWALAADWSSSKATLLVRFRDYREIALGVMWPFREDRVQTMREERNEYMRSFQQVTEVSVDRDLTDQIDRIRPKDGERVQDQRFQAIVNYRHSSDQSHPDLMNLVNSAFMQQMADKEIVARLKKPYEALVGKPAPKLPDDSWVGGERPKLEGKPYLIHFWATWCGPCKNDLPLLKRFSDSGGVVIGLHPGSSSKEDVEAAIEKAELGYPTYLSPQPTSPVQPSIAGYPPSMYPYCVLVDGKGNVVAHGSLRDQEFEGFARYRELTSNGQ